MEIGLKIFKILMMERLVKAGFWDSHLSLNPSRPLLSVLKADQEVFYLLDVDLGDF